VKSINFCLLSHTKIDLNDQSASIAAVELQFTSNSLMGHGRRQEQKLETIYWMWRCLTISTLMATVRIVLPVTLRWISDQIIASWVADRHDTSLNSIPHKTILKLLRKDFSLETC